MFDMLFWKPKVHPNHLCGTNSIGSLPEKEEPNDLIITNHVALDKENSSTRPLTPVIRVWEGDFEVVEPNKADTGTQPPTPLVSYTAWEDDFQAESTEPAPNQSLAKKANLMAHELVHLVTKNSASDSEETSDIELENVVKSINPKHKKKLDKETLLSEDGESDGEEGDGGEERELHRLTSLDNRPLFEDSHLVFHKSVDVNEESITENIYRREESIPVVIKKTDVDAIINDQHGVRNPSFSDEPSTKKERTSRQSSARSSMSSGSRRSKGSNEEVLEMKQLKVHRSSQSSSSDTHEETGLLTSDDDVIKHESSLQGDANRMSQSSVNMGDDTSDDDGGFLGSLGIYMPEGTWDSDLRVELDLQLGREEWETTFLDIRGDATYDEWGANLAEISKGNNQPEDWRSSLSEISDIISIKSEWSTTIPESLLKEDKPDDWNSRFNQIERLSDDRTRWRTTLAKIKERIYDRNEWKFSMKKIGNKKKASKDEWKFKLTNNFESHNNKQNDWNVKFNKPGAVTLAEDAWRLRMRQIDVRSDDRGTHWDTKFLKIKEKNETSEMWQTRFNNIEPIPEDKTWETRIVEPSNELGGPEDWNIKFINIESNKDKPLNWDIEMNNVPDSKNDPSDWNFKFRQLEEHLQNPKEAWNFKFNNILENDTNDRETWENIFKNLDHGNDNKWDFSFNQISNEGDNDLDWQLEVNPIEGVAEES